MDNPNNQESFFNLDLSLLNKEKPPVKEITDIESLFTALQDYIDSEVVSV